MTGREFREIRRHFGLKKPDWMYALGYQGNKNTMFLNCDRYESGGREIPPYLAQYVWMLHQLALHGSVPQHSNGWPIFPEWETYRQIEEEAP